MKLLSFSRRDEGSEFPKAFLSFWNMRVDYGYGPVLRSFGVCMNLPIRVQRTYFCPMPFDWVRGLCTPFIGIRFGFIRGEWRRPHISFQAFMRSAEPGQKVPPPKFVKVKVISPSRKG
jgi:hypothetical protein